MPFSPLYKTVLSIAAPAVIELVLTSLTSLADTVMVGQLGSYAISAVGLTNQPRFIMLAVFIALNVGSTALVARFRGQENKAEAGIVVTQSVFLALVLAVVLMVPGILFARQMVLFMGAGPDTVDDAAAYFRIIMAGFIPTVLPITVSALLRGVGDTATSMRYNITANVVNIVFNYLLIYGKLGFPRLGVAGAAIATVIGNCASCFMALRAITGRSRRLGGSEYARLRLDRSTLRPDFPMLKRMLRIGLPSAGEQLALRAGLLIYTITVTGLGTDVFAAHQIALSILNLSFVNGQAFGIAASTLTGQALGRKEPGSARAASKACQRAGALISALMGLGMFLFRRQLSGLFTTEAAIIELTASVLVLAAFVQPFQASFSIYAGALRGAGDSLYPALSMAVGILCIRPTLSYLAIKVMGLGLLGAWGALVIDQFVRYLLILLRYARGKWVRIEV